MTQLDNRLMVEPWVLACWWLALHGFRPWRPPRFATMGRRRPGKPCDGDTPMKTTFLCVLVFFVLLLAGTARADLMAPNHSECGNRRSGETCILPGGAEGTCRLSPNSDCTRHYSYCIGCVANPDAGTVGTAGKPDGGTPPSHDSGCSLSGGLSASRVAPWAMAGAFSFLVLFLFRPRRR